jgi:nicotinamidase/pyrazinamidase
MTLVVIDEVGYLSYGPDAANVLFQVVNDRHLHRRPMIFTTNKPLGAWGRVLHDPDLAEAILDRVLERGRHIELRGPSYRTRHVSLDLHHPSEPPSERPARLSGKHRPEFPEPTDRREFLSGAAGLVVAGAGGSGSVARAQGRKIAPADTDVLLVVDVQNAFVPGGALPVAEGHEVVPVINRIAPAFTHVVLTQDWHTPGHISFASSHSGRKPFETIQLAYGTQVLWPDHAVQGTRDADLHPDLRIPHAQLIIRKGYRKDVDSYSAFLEADRKTPTGLAGYLRERASGTSTWSGSPPTSASRGRRSMPARWVSTPPWSRTRLAASTPVGRSPGPGRIWKGLASGAFDRRTSSPDPFPTRAVALSRLGQPVRVGGGRQSATHADSGALPGSRGRRRLGATSTGEEVIWRGCAGNSFWCPSSSGRWS